MTTQRFFGKRIIVTGAGRGLGFAFAERLGREGASVIIAEIDPALGGEAERKLKASGVEARFVETDISSEASVEAMAQEAAKELRRHFWSRRQRGLGQQRRRQGL